MEQVTGGRLLSTKILQPNSNHPHQEAPPRALALITAVLETMMGRRPLHQLRPYVTPTPFQRLSRYVDDGTFRRIQISRIKTHMPTERAVEANALLWSAGRWLGCAIRLDVQDQRWVCSELIVLTTHYLSELDQEFVLP